jgi:hypothetical protein
LPTKLQLFQIAQAVHLLPLLLGVGQTGQEQSRKKSDNRDDNQQFNQGKSPR